MLRLYATMQDGHRELTWNTFCCKVLTVIFIVAGPSAETRVHGVVDGRGAERNCERMRKPNRERRVLPFRLSPEHVMLPGKATPPPARSKRECHQRQKVRAAGRAGPRFRTHGSCPQTTDASTSILGKGSHARRHALAAVRGVVESLLPLHHRQYRLASCITVLKYGHRVGAFISK